MLQPELLSEPSRCTKITHTSKLWHLISRLSVFSQVEPMFARQLVYYAGQTNGHYLRGYELPAQGTLPVEEYPRSLQHMQEWSHGPNCMKRTCPRTLTFLQSMLFLISKNPSRPRGQEETGRRGNCMSDTRLPSTHSWTVHTKLCTEKAWNEIVIECYTQYYKYVSKTVKYCLW